MLLIALTVGIIAGALILFVAHLAPTFGAGNFIRDLDQPHLFSKTITRREAHLIGSLVHLLVSGIFGVLFAHLVQNGLFTGFTFLNILLWSALHALFVGGVIFPLEGHGLFGTKEDAWFPIDLALTSLAWGILFWWLMKIWFAVV